MSSPVRKPLISVQSDELKFQFELEKQSFSDIKITNNTEHYVAFKVKTTSPKKYFVRPNTGIVHPWDSFSIRVTLQAQREYPPDMQCRDKFLLQSTALPSNSDSDELPPDTFSKESGRTIEECRLRVVYTYPNSAHGNSDVEASKDNEHSSETNISVQRARDERDAAVLQAQRLQQELDMLKRRRYRKNDRGFSFRFALIVLLIGLVVGIILKLYSSAPTIAPSTE